MKTKFIAAAGAAALWAATALAGEVTTTTTTEVTPDQPGATVQSQTTVSPDPDPLNAPAPIPDPSLAPMPPPQEPIAAPTYDQDRYDDTLAKPKTDTRGVSVALGGGVEGYSGDLAPQINPGPTWGVRAAVRPTKVLGLELAYTGAANELDRDLTSTEANGADIVRNGGEAVATIGLTAAPVQPYLMGGVGLSNYRVRGGDGFRTDNTGSIPLGGGLRTQVGAFTADARFGYSVLFDNEFAENVAPRDVVGVNSTTGGRYAGTINLGATF